MILQNLVTLLPTVQVIGDINVNIKGIEVDSRKVKQGDLFICLTGFTVDGHIYAPQAIEQGAVAIVCERKLNVDIPQIIVKDTRFAMAYFSDLFYQHPSHRLKVIGVTGTNGKTTITHLIEKILADQGHLSGLIGTIKMKIGNEVFEVKNTTPDANELQKSFARMIDAGSRYAIMEVSSHALELGRVRGVNYHAAIFTNLTQDHLDFHKTMENYRYAKGLLFAQLGNIFPSDEKENKYAILNADDKASEYYKKITAAHVVTYGIDNDADIRAKNIKITAQGTRFDLETFKGNIGINLKMIGKFSVYNALAAIAATLIEGVDLADIKQSLEEVTGVDGRFEPVAEGQDFAVIVDYSHTPDSLENVLKTIKEFVKGKIISVFGAGGDRDKTKRPLMGAIAVKYSDLAIVTSDNPRSEDPDQIIADILQGIKKETEDSSKYVTITDRKKAIEYAIEQAGSEDVILIAGKGHETYQIIKEQVIHFDDREVAREAIRSKIK